MKKKYKMSSIQYEELCRYFISKKTGLPINKILSVRIPNPKRKDLPQYSHQIDLYWETDNAVCLYLNIANAKWRNNEKVKQGDVLLIQQVKQDLSAHKAIMITNTGFTSGAVAAARDKGIALHIVQPTIDTSVLEKKNRTLIQSKIQELTSSLSQPIFKHNVIYKAFELTESTPSPISSQGPLIPSFTKEINTNTNKAIGNSSHKGGFDSGHINKSSSEGFKTK